MSEIHSYRTTARWTGNRSGVIEGEGLSQILSFSAPPEFQGEKDHWSPELFYVAAAGTCYLTTFVAIAQFSKLALQSIEVTAEARLERIPGQGYHFAEILLRPSVTLASEADREKAQRLLEKAEKSCIVNRALKTPQRLEPTFHFAVSAA